MKKLNRIKIVVMSLAMVLFAKVSIYANSIPSVSPNNNLKPQGLWDIAVNFWKEWAIPLTVVLVLIGIIAIGVSMVLSGAIGSSDEVRESRRANKSKAANICLGLGIVVFAISIVSTIATLFGK